MKFRGGFALAPGSGRRAGSDLRQAPICCLGSKRELPQAAQELPVDLVGVRLQQHRQAMQMHA